MSTTAVLIAGASVVVSYLAFRSETDPDVVLYAQADVGRPSIINLIIENKGRASAEKITFEWSGKLPARAWGVQSGGKDSSETMNEGPLVQGIPSLPAGDKRVITWGQYGGLYDALAGGAKDIVIRFRSKSRLLSRYRTHETTCSLDIRSFEATDASDRNWAKKIAENLDELKRSIEKESQDWLRRLDTTHEHGLPARNMRKAGDGETGGADG
jgi:hypothetical protein